MVETTKQLRDILNSKTPYKPTNQNTIQILMDKPTHKHHKPPPPAPQNPPKSAAAAAPVRLLQHSSAAPARARRRRRCPRVPQLRYGLVGGCPTRGAKRCSFWLRRTSAWTVDHLLTHQNTKTLPKASKKDTLPKRPITPSF